MKPLFSIIVPVYGVEEYIERCIISILNQEYNNYEIILVDDGSPDRSSQICDSYAKKSEKIHVVHKKNEGLVSARKTGLEYSNGIYVLNVDGDDYVKPNLLSSLAKIVDEYNPDVISFDYDLVDEKDSFICVHHDKLKENLLDHKAIKSVLSHVMYDIRENDHNTGCITYNIWSKAIKRELLMQSQYAVPNQIRMGEDLAVVVPTLEMANSLYISSFSGYAYRQRSNSMVKTFNYDEDKNIIILIQYLIASLKKVDKNNIYCYAVRMGLGQLIKAARQLDDYCKFKEYANDFYERAYSKWLSEFNHPALKLERRLRLWVIKQNYWLVFWKVYSR